MDASKRISNLTAVACLSFLILTTFDGFNFASAYKYSPKQARCEPIEISICDSMRYNTTRMPNSFGHSNQREAAEAIEEFLPLIRVGCSKLLRFFLCSRFVPICSEQDGDSFIVPPCKSFCMQVKAGCAPVLAKLSFNWPPSLDCQNLPASSDSYNVCVEPPERDGEGGTKPRKYELFDFGTVLRKNSRGEHEEGVKELNWLLGQMNKPSQDTCRGPRYVEVDGPKEKFCTPKCSIDVLFSYRDKEFIKTWLTLWSVVSAFSCAFTVLSYLSKAVELRYPEKPALYVAVCCAFESAAYAARLLVDGRRSQCSRDSLIVGSDASSWLCTTFAVVLYYFDAAGLTWWLLLSLSWFLAAVRKWGQEAISSLGVFYHLVAWSVPGLAAGAVVASGNVEGDELLGMCRVASRRAPSILIFSVFPLALSLLLGGLFTCVGFVSVFRVLKQLKASFNVEDAQRLERLIFRMGIFSVVYATTAASQLACHVVGFASVDGWIRESMSRPCLDGWEENDQKCRLEKSVVPVELYLVQIFASLSIGITTTVWVWSRKTLTNWGRLLNAFCLNVFCCKRSKNERTKSLETNAETQPNVLPQKTTQKSALTSTTATPVHP